VPVQVAGRCQRLDMVFDRVAAYACYFDRVGNCDAAVFARNVQDLNGQGGRLSKHDPLSFNLSVQPELLLLQPLWKKGHPRLPVTLSREE